MSNFVLRQLEKGDLPFIFNSWLKSYRDAPSMAGIPNSLYYQGQHTLIERLLEGACVIVACSPEDPSQIMGYGVANVEPQPGSVTLHWIYVKHPFRSFGVAKAIEGAFVNKATTVYYTHRVKACDRLMRSRSYVYNPFLLSGK